MTLCEGATGAGLQVALEADRPLLLRKLYDNVNLPRPAGGGVGAATRVVVAQPRVYI